MSSVGHFTLPRAGVDLRRNEVLTSPHVTVILHYLALPRQLAETVEVARE